MFKCRSRTINIMSKEKVWKEPNRKRRFKIIYYVLLFIFLIMSLTFFSFNRVDTIMNEQRELLVEGKDYFEKEIVVIEKKEEDGVDYSSAPLGEGSLLVVPHVKHIYYFVGNNGEEIETDNKEFYSTNVGDSKIVYKAKNGKYYSNLFEAKTYSLAKKYRIIDSLTYWVTILGMFGLIVTIISRKSMVNPYYNAFYNGEFL